MAGQKAGQPREHQRLHRELAVGVERRDSLGIVHTTFEQLIEQRVEIAAQVVAASRRLCKHRLGMNQEAPVQVTLELVFLVEIAAHC